MGLSSKVGKHVFGALVLAVAAVGCGSSGLSASAGDDLSVNVGEAPVFDGCGSSGEALIYTWTIVEAPDDMADDVGKVLRDSITDCSFTLESDMEIADAGTWVIEVSVTDGSDTATDQVSVTVS